ncbi:hypothetical protein [Pedobacter sp.]
MKKQLFYGATCMMGLFFGCQEDIQNPAASLTTVPQLKRMEWPTLGQTATFGYATDGTLRTAKYQHAAGTIDRDYTYGANGVIGISSSQSLAGNSFEYIGGRLSKMNRYVKDGSAYRTYQTLTYTFNAHMQLTALKFYKNNTSGTELVYTSTYDYISGLPAEIETTSQTGRRMLIRIKQYSDEVIYNPLHFLDPEITQLYPLYNLPLLQHMANWNKLPAVFKLYRYEQNQPVLEKTYEFDYTIVNRKLLKQRCKITDIEISAVTVLETTFHY